MAAPMVVRWISRKLPRIFQDTSNHGGYSNPMIRYSIALSQSHNDNSSTVDKKDEMSARHMNIPNVNNFDSLVYLSKNLENSSGFTRCKNRNSTTLSQRHYSEGQPDDSPDGENRRKRPLKLMDFPEIIWPHPIKSIRNMFMTFLIKSYFDLDFTTDSFLNGALQAVNMVSDQISKGTFQNLEGLVDKEAIKELKYHYKLLSPKQKQLIALQDNRDIFFKFIYEIGIMYDDSSDQRFVEITTVFQGFHGLNEAKEKDPGSYAEQVKANSDQIFVCNYRFIREYTKGKVADDWIINKANHFSPKEIVDGTNIFQR